jgi:hypothetical protein
MAHVHSIKAESVSCWLYWHVMEVNKRKIRV